MFESPDNSALTGGVIRNYRIAEANRAAAERAADSAAAWKAEYFKMRDIAEKLMGEVALEKAHAAGREAQVDALLDAHPQSPLATDSGRKFKSGKAKTRIRLIYESTFDRIAVEEKLPGKPTDYRAD